MFPDPLYLFRGGSGFETSEPNTGEKALGNTTMCTASVMQTQHAFFVGSCPGVADQVLK